MFKECGVDNSNVLQPLPQVTTRTLFNCDCGPISQVYSLNRNLTLFSPSETQAEESEPSPYCTKWLYCLWPFFLAITSTGGMGLWFCGILSRSSRRLIGNVSGFKVSQKVGPRLKVSSVRL